MSNLARLIDHTNLKQDTKKSDIITLSEEAVNLGFASICVNPVHIEIACLVEAEDMEFNTDEFGPDLRQNATFSFVRQSLRDLSLVLEIGDVVEWFTAYWEITNINENQLVGGQYKQLDGQHIHSVVCSANLLRRSNLNIEEVRSI